MHIYAPLEMWIYVCTYVHTYVHVYESESIHAYKKLFDTHIRRGMKQTFPVRYVLSIERKVGDAINNIITL